MTGKKVVLTEEQKQKNKEYQKKYYQEKNKDPDFRNKRKAWWTTWYNRPENRSRVLAEVSARHSSPEGRMRRRLYDRKRLSNPIARAKHNAAVLLRYNKNKGDKKFMDGYRKRDLSRYGLTIAGYDAMAIAQNNLCSICKCKPERLHVDHDHQTGKVRALLCHSCNAGLGFFKDCPELLIIAEAYLRKHSPPETPEELSGTLF